MFYPTTCVGLRYGPTGNILRGFSWEPDYHRYHLVPEDAVYCHVSAGAVDLPAAPLPTRFNVLFRQYADVSLLRRPIVYRPGNRIFTVCPSGTPCGCPLGPDLP